MVTQRQVRRLKKDLKEYNREAYIFSEVDGVLLDEEGREVSDRRLTALLEQDNTVIIDDI